MSYRSVKHVLGETRLELKFLVLFAICLLTLIGGSFWWYGGRTELLVNEKAQSTGRDLVHSAVIEDHWKALAEKEKQNSKVIDGPNFKDLYDSISRGSQTQSYTYRFMVRNSKEEKLQPQDDFEAFFLEHVPNRNPSEANGADGTSPNQAAEPVRGADYDYRIVQNDKGESLYEYYQPVYATVSSCVTCHQVRMMMVTASAGLDPQESLREGDLLGVAKVVTPDATLSGLNKNRAIFLATAVLTVFLAMIASYVIVRYIIVKPLKHLRDVSDEISQGNMEARADIHTADEFEEVGLAFNKMVRHLVSTQEELKQTNTTLDTKVDELAQTNMRLYEMNRLKSDFLATMSHELRTPLNSIIGFSEVLDSIKSLDDKQRRYVQNIQKSGRVLLDMINDILDLAKIESGKMDLRLGEFRIDRVVLAQCDFVRPQTERKNIDLEVEIEPGLPELFQDQAKTQQILSNLLSNAIKFTPEGGRITVTARRGARVVHSPTEPVNGQADLINGLSDSHIRKANFGEAHESENDLLLEVADTGVGIAEEDQVTIFEKFRQGQAVMTQGDAITREFSGTGLGLSIVKELCKLLGGEITLQSQIGRGSTFTVRLPLTCPGHAKVDAAIQDNLEEMLRPWRQEVQRTLDRPVPAAPGAER